MNGGEAETARTESDFDIQVADHLRGHPDFFHRHPAVLASLDLPHDCGSATSLVEYQVSVLRNQNLHLRRKLEALVETARENETLSQRLHRLTLNLLACEELDQVIVTLYESMRADFGADQSAVRLFVPHPTHAPTMPELAGDDTEGRQLCAGILRAKAPVCGRLGEDLKSYLFGSAAEGIGSAVVLPLGEVERFGIVAIGAHDESRFQPGMGTVFLRQMADVAASVILARLGRD